MMENVMGTKKENILLIEMSIPIIISLFVNSLYNFIDSIFVSHIGESALTALSLANPMQLLMSAVGSGVAVGLNAVISKALGENNREKVKGSASAALFLAFLCWIIMAFIAVFVVTPYFKWQSSDQDIINYGTSYLFICMFFSIFNMGQWVFDRFTLASGKSYLFLFTLSTASLTNILLDPILIYGYFGLPALNTTGAALATVIGQGVGCICGYIINKKYNQEIPVYITLKVNLEYLKEILSIGIPTTIVQGLVSIIGIFMNSMLSLYSTTAVAVYGACTKIQSLTLLTFISGINNALIPIVAYNYGAEKPQRIINCVKWAIIYEYGLYLIMFIFMHIFNHQIFMLFDASSTMMNIGITALNYLSIAWLFSIISLIIVALFQGFGLGSISMILNLSRQVIFLFIFVFIFRNSGLSYIWLSFILAEVCTIPIDIMMLFKYKNLLKWRLYVVKS